MKFLDVFWEWPTDEFVEKFMGIFLEDMNKVFKERKLVLSQQAIIDVILKVNELLAKARGTGYAFKKILAKVIRIELEIPAGPKIKFTFIPLDDRNNPIIPKERCPFMIFPADGEDIKNIGKGKSVKLSIDGTGTIGLN